MSANLAPNRIWQIEAERRVRAKFDQNHTDALVVAPPGAGKTRFSLQFAKSLKDGGLINYIWVVAPTDTIKDGWIKTAKELGINLAGQFGNDTLTRIDPCKKGYDGSVHTYAQIASETQLFRTLTSRHQSLLFGDEWHHSGDGKAWGEAMKIGFEPCKFRVFISGTPYRNGPESLPFVNYDQNGIAIADYTLSRTQALSQKIIRRYAFTMERGEMEWLEDGERNSAKFEDALKRPESRRRHQSSLIPTGQVIEQLFIKAHRKIMTDRQNGYPVAAAIAFAKDIPHANHLAQVCKRVTGCEPTVVHIQAQDSRKKIRDFAEGNDEWMISVKKVGEGVDIPRLTAAVYASHVTGSRAFVEQAIGRVSRVVKDYEWLEGAVFMPADPELVKIASEIEEEQVDVVGPDIEPGEPKPREPDAQTFVPLNAQSIGYFGVYSGDEFSSEELKQAATFQQTSTNPAYKFMSLQLVATLLKDDRINVDLEPIAERAEDETLDEKFERKRQHAAKLAKQVDSRLGLDWGTTNRRWVEKGRKRADEATLEDLDAKIEWMEQLLIDHSQQHLNPVNDDRDLEQAS